MCPQNLKNDYPTMLEIVLKDDETKKSKLGTEKHHHWNLLKTFKIDKGYYKKNY